MYFAMIDFIINVEAGLAGMGMFNLSSSNVQGWDGFNT